MLIPLCEPMSWKKNLLFVVHRVPYPPDRGDRIRSYNLLKFLAAHANVWLATLADEPLHPDCESELQHLCRDVRIEHLNNSRYLRGIFSLATGASATEGIFYSKSLRSMIQRWCGEVQFDAAVGFCSSVAPYLEISELRNVPKYVDLVDVDSEKFFAYAANATGIKKRFYQMEAKRVRSLEKRLGRECRGITLVTEPEADLYRQFAPAANVKAATNGIDLDYYQFKNHPKNALSTPTCLFVGALNYPPNSEGIEWFCRNAWPQVLVKTKDARLLIVGRNPTPEVSALNDLEGVEVLANVPDVRPYYQLATVAIVPLRIARGLQNKILEAFAMKTAVLSTPEAIEGIDLAANQAVVATTAEEWITELTELFHNALKREKLTTAAYDFVATRHSWSNCLQPVADLLELSAVAAR